MAFNYVAFEELKSQIENTVKDWAGKYNFDDKKIINYFQTVTDTDTDINAAFSLDNVFPKSAASNYDKARKIEIGILLLTLFQLEKLDDPTQREIILNAICFFVRNSVTSDCKRASFFIYTPKEQNSTLYTALNTSLRLDKENPDATEAQYKEMSKSLYYFWRNSSDIFDRAFNSEGIAKSLMGKLKGFCMQYNRDVLASDLCLFNNNFYKKPCISEPMNTITVSSC